MILKSQSGKSIGVFGLGKTGISAVHSLYQVTKSLVCYDQNSESSQITDSIAKNYFADLSDIRWKNLDKILVSPGVPHSNEIFHFARENKIQILSDIEMFYDEIRDRNPEIIVVSGTNGKSTTVSLIHHILMSNGIDYALGGNIGAPVLSLDDNKKGYILELSSFQLDILDSKRDYQNKIAVLLDLTPDHLDRYDTLNDYYASKIKLLNLAKIKIILAKSSFNKKLIRSKVCDTGVTVPIIFDISETINVINQDQNFIRDNKNDSILQNISNVSDQPYANQKCIFLNQNHNPLEVIDNFFQNEYKFTISDHSIRHNIENIAASIAVAKSLNIPNENILKCIESFISLPHRMEYIKYLLSNTGKKINFYNNSKATNLSSAIASLLSLRNIFWLAGGIYKELEFDIPSQATSNIVCGYFFGRDKNIFEKYCLSNNIKCKTFNDIDSAFKDAISDSVSANIDCNILLSPATASYDQFRNFEHRGNHFKSIVDKCVISRNCS